MKYIVFYLLMLSFISCVQETGQVNMEKFGATHLHLEYYEDHTIKSIGQKIDNNKIGTWIYFSSYGEKLREIDFEDDIMSGQYIEYRQGKVLWKETFVDGKRNGLAQYFNFKCGTLVEEGLYVNDEMNGLWYNYNRGFIVTIEKFDNGVLIETLYKSKTVKKDLMEEDCCCEKNMELSE